MSVKISDYVWKHSKAKTHMVKLVQLALADYADEDRRAWPSLSKLAAKTLLSVKSVCTALNQLEQLGEIERKRSTGGKNQRSEYLFLMPGNCETTSQNNREATSQLEPNCESYAIHTVKPASHAINRHRTVNSVKGKPSRKTADPEVREFIGWYAAQYKERFDERYHIAGGKHGQIVKELLRTFGLAELKERAVILFESEDLFISKTDRGIGILRSQINKLGKWKALAGHNGRQPGGFVG